jgi:hypothetical protein
MPKASKKFDAHNRVFDGIRSIDDKIIDRLINSLKEADYSIGISAGRAGSAIDIPFGEAVRSHFIEYINYNDLGFPADTFIQAAPEIEIKHNKANALFVSNSGETEETYSPLEDLITHVINKKSDKWNIFLSTQNADSTAGQKMKQIDGTTILLKGSDNTSSKNYREYGMMRSIGEHEVLWTFQIALQTLHEKKTAQRFKEIVDEKLPEVYGDVDKWSDSDTCKDIVYNLRRHSNAFIGGRKGAREVAKFVVKRLGQVKQIAGDNAYLYQGANSPDPRVGDVFLMVSKSGGAEYSDGPKGKISPMVGVCEKAQDVGSLVYPFTTSKYTPMGSVCGRKNTAIIKSESVEGFSDAYARILCHLDIIPILLAEAYGKEGLDISPQNLKKTHGF